MALVLVMVVELLPLGLGSSFARSEAAVAGPDYTWYGDGSDAGFSIGTAEALLGFANLVNGTDGKSATTFSGKEVTLTANLDLTGVNWMPIGDNRTTAGSEALTGPQFNGIFTGGDFMIKGINVNISGSSQNVTQYGGLFGVLGSTSMVRHLRLVEPSITVVSGLGTSIGVNGGGAYAGGIAGLSKNPSGGLWNCHVIGGSVTVVCNDGGSADVASGGLVGKNNGRIMISSSSATVSSAPINILSGTYSDQSKIPSAMIGGLVGDNRATIDLSSSSGSVINNIPRGTVTPKPFTGGIAGLSNTNAISRCLFVGTVTGVTSPGSIVLGGIIGGSETNASVGDCKYSGSRVPSPTQTSGLPLTDIDLKNESNFIGWEFSSVWRMGPNYPILKGFKEVPAECQCVIGTFTVAGNDHLVIPYGSGSTAFTLAPTAPSITHSACTVPGHNVERAVKYTYIVKSAALPNATQGTVVDGASIDPLTKIVTFTKAGTYTVDVYAGDALSLKMQNATASFTVTEEKCTCIIPDFTLVNKDLLIPYKSTSATMTLSTPISAVAGNCGVTGHSAKNITYVYSVVSKDDTVTSAAFNGNQLTAEGEGKINIRLTATVSGTSAVPVIRDAVVHVSQEICTCSINEFTFSGSQLLLRLGESSVQKVLVNPAATYKACTVTGHASKAISFEYSIVPDSNTAGATLNGNTLLATQSGAVTLALKASVAGTEAVLIKTAVMTVASEQLEIPDHLKNIQILAGNDATLGWESNISGTMNIKIKNPSGTVVKTDTVNIADRKYTVPAALLSGLDTYSAELSVAGKTKVITASISILSASSSILFNPAESVYYDDKSVVNLSWKTGKVIAGTSKKVTIKKDKTTYTDFVVNGDALQIKEIQKPSDTKDTYTVTITWSNGSKVIASDSFTFTVYRTNTLQITNAKNEAGVKYTNNSPLIISNNSEAEGMTAKELLENANSFTLQRVVKLSQPYSSYGDDHYQWTIADPSIIEFGSNAVSGGIYSSASLMTLVGLKDGETLITVKHMGTNTTTSFKVTVETLKNKLFILKTTVAAPLNLQYSVGKETKMITTNTKGLTAIFAKSGIVGMISTYGENDEKVYLGQTDASTLLSGEARTAKSQYPISKISAIAATNITLKLSASKSEKLIKDSKVMVNGYLLKNEVVVGTKSQEVKIKQTDYQNVVLNFDTTPLIGLSATDSVKFVYEVVGVDAKTYSPAYASIEPKSGGASPSSGGTSPSSGGAEFGEVQVKLQPWKSAQEAYVNSVWQSTKLTGAWQDASTKTGNVNIDTKTPVKYIKTVICWPKNKIGAAALVNSKGDSVGTNSVSTSDKTLDNMKYSWQEVVIKVDTALIAKGTGLKFSYSLYTTSSKSIQIPSSFGLANVIGIKDFNMSGGIPFLGVIDTGKTAMKVIGSKGVSIPMPSELSASFDYQFDEDPLNGTFQVIFGREKEDSSKEDTTFKEDFEKAVKSLKTKSKATDKEAKVTVNISGYLMGDIKYRGDQWVMVITGGGLQGGVEGSYSYSQTQFLGPVPVCYGVEFKLGADLTVGIDTNRVIGGVTWDNFAQTLEIYIDLYTSISAYGGVGVDYGWVAARVGLFGELGLEYYFRSSFIEQARRNGGQLKIEGSIGLEAVFKFLFYKKRYVMCEAGFEKSFKPNGFDFTDYGGFKSPLAMSTMSGLAFVEQIKGNDGKVYNLYESEYTIDNRAYLSQAQAWNEKGQSADYRVATQSFSLMNMNTGEPVVVGTNQYPYGYPMLSNDGNMMAVLSDFASKDVNDTGAGISIKAENGSWSTPTRIFAQSENTPASSLSFDGGATFAAAAWESTPNKIGNISDDDSVSSVDISTTLSKSEIYASIYSGSVWTTKRVTSNSEADMAPSIASNNGHAVMVWQRVNPSADDPMKVTTKNELWFSTWTGTDWSSEKLLDSGDAGSIKSFNAATAPDGSARVVANIDIDRDDSTVIDRDVFGYNIATDQTFTRQNLTNNNSQDGSAKVSYRKIAVDGVEKDYFLTAWYSEQTGENGALLSRDIKLSAESTDGVKADNFPSSLGSGNGTGNFNFIKSTESTPQSVGIVWTQTTGTSAQSYQTLFAKVLTNGEAGGLTTTPAYEVSSVNPDQAEIAKFETSAKTQMGVIQLEATYLKNNLALVNEEGSAVAVIKAISADLMKVSKEIKEAIQIKSVDYSASGVEKGRSLPITLAVFNNGLSKVDSLNILANNQTFSKEISLMPNETKSVVIDYLVDDAISDVSVEITPIYGNQAIGTKITKTVMLSKPDVTIKEVVLAGTGDSGKRLVDVNLKNIGMKTLVGSGNKVQVKVYDDFARTVPTAVEDLSTGTTVYSGEIIIEDPEKLAEIDNGLGTCKFGYTVLAADYDKTGNKTLYLDVNIIDADKNIVEESTYTGNQGGITFTSPKLLYPTQFEVTVIQGVENGVSTAEIEVRNLYPEASKDTLKLRLLSQNQTIEEKSIDIQLGAETSVKQHVTFAKSGSKITAAFLSDIKLNPVPTPNIKEKDGNTQIAVTAKPIALPLAEKGSVTLKEANADGNSFVSSDELKQINTLTVKGKVTVTFDKKAVESLVSKGDLTISITELDRKNLAEQALKMIGDRPVYNIAVRNGSGSISSFNNGMIKMNVPYEIKAGEELKALLAYYVTPEGVLKPVYSSYDQNTKTLNFMTNHLSTYAIGYNKVNFSDVDGWASTHITYLAAHHIISGNGSGKFTPNANVTRAEFVSMLFEILGEDKKNWTNGKVSTFKDVKSSDWFAPYATWAVKNGIASGTGNNSFAPNTVISREQMTTMMYQFMKRYELTLKAEQKNIAFKDQMKLSPWSLEAVTYLQTAGVISGSPEGLFAPNKSSKRSEAAAMLAGFMERIAK